MRKKKGCLGNIILLAVSIIISLIVVELAFRYLLFGNSEKFDFLRKPEYYATIYKDPYSSIFSDEYWKLYYKFDGHSKPPKNPHPTLGWVFEIDRKTLMHQEADSVRNRRPVLLYGDSFSDCSKGAVCFEEMLNIDTSFIDSFYLLNYGMGGYGIGQISMLLELSNTNYNNPVIIYGFMIRDMERSLLSVRIGQKPSFRLIKDSLVVKGLPIEPDPYVYFEKNPPGITSYLYRKFRSNKINFLPKNKRKTKKRIEEIKEVNKRIILKTLKYLEENNKDYFVVVFHPLNREKGDWRSAFLRQLMEGNDVNYIWTRDLVDKEIEYTDADLRTYELPDGHPTTHFNSLISDEIKKYVLDPGYRIEAKEANSRIYREKLINQ